MSLPRKTYECQKCSRKILLRSTIREGEFKGLKVCTFCKNKFEAKKPKKKVKVVEADTSKRDFFQAMIELLQLRPVCENCGCRINTYIHPVNNIAHILPKRTYKSVATHPKNILFLCTSKDHPMENPKNCHGTFDKDISSKLEMKVFPLARKRLESIKDEIIEKGKELDVYQF